MMLWNFLLAFYIVYADVIREDGYNNYVGQFTVKHRGRMLRVLMFFRNIPLEECALHCVRHLRCKTYNYHHGRKDCELTDEEFDKMNADTITLGWYNYGTPKRVNGAWSSWRSFTDCTKSCGGGTVEQYRECDSPKPQHGGSDCKGRMRRKKKCNTHGCPVHGGFGDWRDSSICSKTCGGGTLEQKRDCDSPTPQHGGAECTGDATRRVECNTNGCPVHGGFGDWRDSSYCSKTCGGGTLQQKRDCDSPTPQHGGVDCTGDATRTVDCNTNACPVGNVALDKAAKQSSTWSDGYVASNAVDGNTGTSASTNHKLKQWWEVDLGEVRVVKEIRLNADAYANYNNGLLVETRTKGDENWSICKAIGDVQNKITEFQCREQLTKARFVRIRSTKECFLEFYEVEIFGY